MSNRKGYLYRSLDLVNFGQQDLGLIFLFIEIGSSSDPARVRVL